MLVFFTKVLLIDEDNKLINFESKIFPEFEMRDLNGNQVSAQSLSGIKILNVWASWCITCLVEHPFLSQLSEKNIEICLLYTSPSPRDATLSRMPSSA